MNIIHVYAVSRNSLHLTVLRHNSRFEIKKRPEQKKENMKENTQKQIENLLLASFNHESLRDERNR